MGGTLLSPRAARQRCNAASGLRPHRRDARWNHLPALCSMPWLCRLRTLRLAALLLAFVLAAGLPGAANTTAEPLPPPCQGRDLLAELAVTDPDLFADLRTAASQVPNDGAILWRVEVDPNLTPLDPPPPSYLYGTIHVTDPRVVSLPVAARAALESAKVVALEIVDISPSSVNRAIAALGPDIVFTDGLTLTDYLDEREQADLIAVLAEQGLPGDFVMRFKPWFLSAMLALPACERARNDAGAPALDIRIEQLADTLGIATVGLETLISQFEVMASLPFDAQLSWLRTSVALHASAEDDLETLINLYLRREVAMIWAYNRMRLDDDPDLRAGMEDFQLTLIDRRNHEMLDGILPLIEQGRAFIAVGALHLPGPDGLVALLRDAGYRVTAIE